MTAGPVYVPRDTLTPIKAFLIAEFPTLPAPFETTTVGLSLPANWDTGHPPAVVLFDDSGPVLWPVATDHTVRATVWSDGRSTSRTIAARVMGLLLCRRIDGIAKVLPGSTSILDARDDSNGGLLASITVRTRVRTAAV